ncbi:zinc-binding dehydrogenase [Salana multivorans]
MLQRDEVPVPTLRPGEVLIETVSSGVSDIDLMYRSGRLRMHGVGFPKQPGFDVLGVVRDTRNAAVQPGRWVWSVLGLEPSRRRGTAVEYLRVDSRRIGLFLDGCTPQAEVGALALGALTALKSLRSARVAGGQRILVVGAAGAVGTAAIQLARFFDADVDAVAGPAGLDLCRGLGATRVFDHTTASVDTARTSGSYDAVVVAAGRGKDWLDAARSGGRVVLTRADSWVATIPSAVRSSRCVLGVAAGHSAADLTWLAQRVAEGQLAPTIGKSYDIDDLAQAHSEYGQGGTAGARLIRHQP